MNIKERAREQEGAYTCGPPKSVALILEEAIRAGLRDAAAELDLKADRAEKTYADLGMDGYAENRMRREAAEDLRKRANLP